MKQKENSSQATSPKKLLLTHLGIILSAFLLLLIYFKPVVVEDKQMLGNDLKQFRAMAREIIDLRESGTKQPLWTNTMFSGMPGFQIITPPTKNLIKKAYAKYKSFLYPVSGFFLLFIGFYILLLFLGVNPWLSAIGAFSFMLSTDIFIIIAAGHSTKTFAIAFWPFIILGILMVYRGRYLAGALVTSLAVSLELIANHYQITYYLLIIIVGIAGNELYLAVKNKTLPTFFKSSGILLLAAFIGVGTNIGSLWTTYEYAQSTIRGKAVLKANNSKDGLDKNYALSWSSGKAETFTYLVPMLYGGSSHEKLTDESETYKTLRKRFSEPIAQKLIKNWPVYYGSQPFTDGPFYFGIIILFLFVLALMILPGTLKWWLSGVTLLAVMLAWGKNFPLLSDLFFEFMPMYNKFRAVSMIQAIPSFTFPFLGILGLSHLLKEGKVDNKFLTRKLFQSVVVFGSILLIFFIGAPFIYDFLQSNQTWNKDLQTLSSMLNGTKDNPIIIELAESLRFDRTSMIRWSAFRGLVLVLIAGILIWGFLKNKLNQYVVIAGLTLVVLFDQLQIGAQYLNEDSFTEKPVNDEYFEPAIIDLQILQDKDPHYRVFNLNANTYNDASSAFFHKCIGGYHAAKLRRYQDMINYHLTKGRVNEKVLNMLNGKYIIFDNDGEPDVELNPDALGNAWFVEEIQWVDNPDEEITALFAFEPKKTAVIDRSKWYKQIKSSPEQPKYDSTATIKLTSYSPDHMIYESRSPYPQFAVFSEIFYAEGKGWQTYVDGKPVDHYRVNYLLRGMHVPGGVRTIEFKFEPKSYYVGEWISFGFSLLILIGIGAVLVTNGLPKKE